MVLLVGCGPAWVREHAVGGWLADRRQAAATPAPAAARSLDYSVLCRGFCTLNVVVNGGNRVWWDNGFLCVRTMWGLHRNEIDLPAGWVAAHFYPARVSLCSDRAQLDAPSPCSRGHPSCRRNIPAAILSLNAVYIACIGGFVAGAARIAR